MPVVQSKLGQKETLNQSSEIINNVCCFAKEELKDGLQIPFKKTAER
jgi:hypothetical protein